MQALTNAATSCITTSRGQQHSFVEIDREIFSTVIRSLPLIQEGQLSVSGERMCTCPVNVWLGKLTALNMTPLSWLDRKTSTHTNKQTNHNIRHLYQLCYQEKEKDFRSLFFFFIIYLFYYIENICCSLVRLTPFKPCKKYSVWNRISQKMALVWDCMAEYKHRQKHWDFFFFFMKILPSFWMEKVTAIIWEGKIIHIMWRK